MKKVLIKDVPDRVIAELEKRAARNERSLEAEIRHILVETAEQMRRMARWKKEMEKFRASFGDRKLPDSTKLIRRERDRR